MNKMKQRWKEQFRMFRFDHQENTRRAPLVAAVGYPYQRSDRLAARARMLNTYGANEPIRRAHIVKDTTSKAGHIRLSAA